jgi:hypothetical protein
LLFPPNPTLARFVGLGVGGAVCGGGLSCNLLSCNHRAINHQPSKHQQTMEMTDREYVYHITDHSRQLSSFSIFNFLVIPPSTMIGCCWAAINWTSMLSL